MTRVQARENIGPNVIDLSCYICSPSLFGDCPQTNAVVSHCEHVKLERRLFLHEQMTSFFDTYKLGIYAILLPFGFPNHLSRRRQ